MRDAELRRPLFERGKPRYSTVPFPQAVRDGSFDPADTDQLKRLIYSVLRRRPQAHDLDEEERQDMFAEAALAVVEQAQQPSRAGKTEWQSAADAADRTILRFLRQRKRLEIRVVSESAMPRTGTGSGNDEDDEESSTAFRLDNLPDTIALPWSDSGDPVRIPPSEYFALVAIRERLDDRDRPLVDSWQLDSQKAAVKLGRSSESIRQERKRLRDSLHLEIGELTEIARPAFTGLGERRETVIRGPAGELRYFSTTRRPALEEGLSHFSPILSVGSEGGQAHNAQLSAIGRRSKGADGGLSHLSKFLSVGGEGVEAPGGHLSAVGRRRGPCRRLFFPDQA